MRIFLDRRPDPPKGRQCQIGVAVPGHQPLGTPAGNLQCRVARPVVVHHIEVLAVPDMRFITRRILSARPVVGVGKPGFVRRQPVGVPGNLPIGIKLERDSIKALTAALKQSDNPRLFVGIGYAIDDPEFLAVRQGGLIVQDEQGVVEGLAPAMPRLEIIADDADKHEAVLRFRDRQGLVGIAGSPDPTPDITLVFDFAFGRNQQLAYARQRRFEVLPRSLELEIDLLPGGSARFCRT
ncbi:MAG: hypothetical protein ABJB10_05505 [Mesorhizobium sp.]